MTETLDKLSEEIALAKVGEDKAISLRNAFTPFFEQAKEWAEKAKEIKVVSVDQVGEMKQAKEARLQIKKVRTSVENLRKEMKEGIVKEGKAIDGVANVIKDLITPIEDYLMEQEKFAERIEAERLEKLKNDRLEELSKFGFDGQLYPLAAMADEAYQDILATAKLSHERKEAEKRKAEEDRIENERMQKLHNDRKEYLVNADLWQHREAWLDSECLADLTDERWVLLKNDLGAKKAEHLEAQEKLRMENERFKKEAEEKELKKDGFVKRLLIMGYKCTALSTYSKEGFSVDEERLKVMSEDEFKERVDLVEEKIKEKRKEAEIESLIFERTNIIQPYYRFFEEKLEFNLGTISQEAFDEILTDLKAKKAQKDKQEADDKAERDRLAKLESDRIAAEQERIKSEQSAKLAPDKDKVLAFAKAIESIDKPDLKSAEANEILTKAVKALARVSTTIRQEITSL